MNYKTKDYEGTLLANPVGGMEYNPFTKSQTFINRSRRAVVVLYCDNLPIVVNPLGNTDRGYGDFIIRTVFKFYGHAELVSFCNNIELYATKFPSAKGMLLNMREHVLERMRISSGLNQITLTVDKTIKIEDIVTYQALYIDADDILLSTDDHLGQYPHPRSIEGEVNYHYGIHDSHDCASGVFIEVVDNDNQSGTRFVYAANQVIEVIPIRANGRKDGVYLSTVSTNALGDKEIKTDHKNFGEAKEVWGVYTNYDDALTGGDPSVVSRRELEETTLENTKLRQAIERTKLESETIDANARSTSQELLKEIEILKLENQRIKEQDERNRMVRQEENDRFKEQLEREKASRVSQYEVESLHRKDYYEDRSYGRKDTSELIKVGAIALAAGYGIFKMMSK